MPPKHDFSSLFGHYPEIIAEMPHEFTSHEFILRLAQRHQVEYIDALHAYRDTLRDGKPAPFMIVHGVRAQHLQDCTGHAVQLPDLATSRDIFGEEVTCARWQRR